MARHRKAKWAPHAYGARHESLSEAGGRPDGDAEIDMDNAEQRWAREPAGNRPTSTTRLVPRSTRLLEPALKPRGRQRRAAHARSHHGRSAMFLLGGGAPPAIWLLSAYWPVLTFFQVFLSSAWLVVLFAASKAWSLS